MWPPVRKHDHGRGRGPRGALRLEEEALVGEVRGVVAEWREGEYLPGQLVRNSADTAGKFCPNNDLSLSGEGPNVLHSNGEYPEVVS